MDDITRWKVLANLLISMKTLIEGALGVIQEKIKEIEPARGQEELERSVSQKLTKTFGGKAYEAAKGSVNTNENSPQALE